MAVDPTSGAVYVADQENARVEEFTAWGEFVSAWGWDVVASGPDNDAEGHFEVCAPANGDVCKAGSTGAGPGQFVLPPQGVAVDGDGNVYVVDLGNHRVQKFNISPGSVQFALMFGGNVNKTKVEAAAPEAQRNLCPVDPGDVCQVGTEGTGNGQFGAWSGTGGSFIAAGSDGETIYVGDQGRIQEFDTEGHYLGDLPDTSGLLAPNTVKALAVDPAGGDLYISFANKGFVAGKATPPNVYRLDPSTGELLDTLQVGAPTGIGVDSKGSVYVFDDQVPFGQPGNRILRILQFDSSGNEIGIFDQNQEPSSGDRFSSASTGIAASSACGLKSPDIFVSNPNLSESFVRIYGPPPDPEICPPPEVPPMIEDQYATSVGSNEATVRAAINPRFWADARYYVQYGTGKCSEGGCGVHQPLPPGTLLTEDVRNAAIATAGVFLSGLESATTYHYRFVAQSGGGGPVYGVDPDGSGPEEASLEKGLEGTFTTPLLAPEAKVNCPNQASRTGLSSALPDCRTYEMVSPVDKNNGDIGNDENIFDENNFEAASPDGSRATYSSITSFGEPEGSPLVSQYLSSRGSLGWSTHSISPPRNSAPFYGPSATPGAIQFKAFSPDLCRGWFIQDTALALTPGAPPGVPNIYRRDDGSCGEPGYGLITTVVPPGFVSETDSGYTPEVQGITPDSLNTLLRVPAVLTEDACQVTVPEAKVVEGKGIYQLYLQTFGGGGGGMHLVSVLPNGKASCVHSSAGTAQALAGDPREDSVYHALSTDASRVFWSTSGAFGNQNPPINGGQGDQAGPLYVRLNPAQPPSATTLGGATGSGRLISGNKTVLSLNTTSGTFAVAQSIVGPGIPAGTTITAVSASSLTLSAAATVSETGVPLEASSACTEAQKACTLPVSQLIGSGRARFLGAGEEAPLAFFSIDPDGAKPETEGLYEFEAEEEGGVFSGKARLIAKGFVGLVGLSEEGTRAYFVSTENLTGGQENSQGGKAVGGMPNLYLYVKGGDFTFIGTLAAGDTVTKASAFEVPSPIAALPNKRVSRVSSDGMHAVFTSSASLTGYDNQDSLSREADTEVFLYDASPGGGVGHLACISCNQSGVRPHGRNIGHTTNPYWVVAQVPGWESDLYPTRVLSADGNRLFFESFEGLVQRDTNGQRDVYEWERAGTQECDEVGAELFVASAGGCISLISSGKSSIGSEFLDASASGSDAFITTADSLLPQDPGLVDVYDARAGGGLPLPASPEPPCEGEACQPAPPPPTPSNPASSEFRGEGNVTEVGSKRSHCGKGSRQVVRAGKARCVKKRKRHRKRNASHPVNHKSRLAR